MLRFEIGPWEVVEKIGQTNRQTDFHEFQYTVRLTHSWTHALLWSEMRLL